MDAKDVFFATHEAAPHGRRRPLLSFVAINGGGATCGGVRYARRRSRTSPTRRPMSLADAASRSRRRAVIVPLLPGPEPPEQPVAAVDELQWPARRSNRHPARRLVRRPAPRHRLHHRLTPQRADDSTSARRCSAAGSDVHGKMISSSHPASEYATIASRTLSGVVSAAAMVCLAYGSANP